MYGEHSGSKHFKSRKKQPLIFFESDDFEWFRLSWFLSGHDHFKVETEVLWEQTKIDLFWLGLTYWINHLNPFVLKRLLLRSGTTWTRSFQQYGFIEVHCIAQFSEICGFRPRNTCNDEKTDGCHVELMVFRGSKRWRATCTSTQLGLVLRGQGVHASKKMRHWNTQNDPTCNMSDLWDIVRRSRLGGVLAVPSLWGPWIEMQGGFGNFERFLVPFWEVGH